MTNTPRVSVVMPLYNALPYLKSAIDSIATQSFQDFELLIVDNGSTDGSLDYANSLMDPRVRVLTTPERGAGRATTAGIFASRGKFVAVMDADDVAHADRLRTEVEFLEAHPDVVLVGTRFGWLVGSIIVPVPPQPREHHDIKQALYQGRPVICNATTMFRAEQARKVGGRRLSGAGHDVDFFLRMIEIGRVVNVPDLLYYYRLHERSTSIVKMAEVYRSHAFSIACARARDAGRQEPDFATFCNEREQRRLVARLAELADAKSLQLYRTSVVMRAKKQDLASLAASAAAAFLSPRRTNWHLKRKLGLC